MRWYKNHKLVDDDNNFEMFGMHRLGLKQMLVNRALFGICLQTVDTKHIIWARYILYYQYFIFVCGEELEKLNCNHNMQICVQ